MLRRPALAEDYDALPLGRDTVLLRTPAAAAIRNGPHWGVVLPMADGRRTTDQIVDCAEAAAPAAEIYYALLCLQREGILVEAPSGDSQSPFPVEPPCGTLIAFTTDYCEVSFDSLVRSTLAARGVVPVRLSGDSVWAGPAIPAGRIEWWEAFLGRLRHNCFHISRRASLPFSEAAERTARDWIGRLLQGMGKGEEPALWTGTSRDPTPRLHYFMPGADTDVRQRLEQAASPITGLVAAVERLSSSPVFVDTAWTLAPMVVTSAGKGLDEPSARLGCIAEAAERQSMMWHDGRTPVRRASYRALGGEAVHPAALSHWSARQYNAANMVPLPIDAEIDWIGAAGLGSEPEHRYLPASYCYIGHREAGVTGALGDSNGCAAGPTLEEATVRGFLELVERDAIAIWWYNRLSRPAYRRDEVAAAPAARALAEFLAKSGHMVEFLDLTTDLAVPVAVAVTFGPDGTPRDIGFGCAFDAAGAIHRAALEAGQLIATPQPQIWTWLAAAFGARPEYFRALPAASLTPGPATGDGLAAVRECARRAGLEVLVVDLTREDIGIPVARVTCPGLRPVSPRFGPGRLYDVPVKCGWLPRAWSEEQLNPFPFIL